MDIEKIQREVRIATLRFAREHGPLSRKGAAMLAEMAANDFVALNRPVDRLSLRTQVIDFVNEGARRRHYGQPTAIDLNEVPGGLDKGNSQITC